MVERFTLDSEEARTLYLNTWPLFCESLFSFDLRESEAIRPQNSYQALNPKTQTPPAN